MTIDDYLSKIKEILKDNKQFSDHNLNIFEELFEPAYPDDYGFSEYNIEYDFQFT